MGWEFLDQGVACNALWQRTGIATAEVEVALAGADGMKHCRSPEIMADAAHAIFNKPSRECTGNFFIDDLVLYEAGVRDFDKYRVDPTKPLMPDFFVPENTPLPAEIKMAPAG